MFKNTSFIIEVCFHLSYFICFLCYCIIVKVTFASLRNFYEISWLPFMCDIYSLIHSLIYSYFITYIFNGHTYIFIFYLFLDIYKMKSLFRSVTIGPSYKNEKKSMKSIIDTTRKVSIANITINICILQMIKSYLYHGPVFWNSR